jgi:hypothetical protein
MQISVNSTWRAFSVYATPQNESRQYENFFQVFNYEKRGRDCFGGSNGNTPLTRQRREGEGGESEDMGVGTV